MRKNAQPRHGTAVQGRTARGARPCTPVARPCALLFSSALLFLVLEASSNLKSSLKLLVKSSFLLKSDDFSEMKNERILGTIRSKER